MKTIGTKVVGAGVILGAAVSSALFSGVAQANPASVYQTVAPAACNPECVSSRYPNEHQCVIAKNSLQSGGFLVSPRGSECYESTSGGVRYWWFYYWERGSSAGGLTFAPSPADRSTLSDGTVAIP